MIDLVKNFNLREQDITRWVMNNKEAYKASSCYKRLKNGYTRLRDSNDMVFGGQGGGGTFKSKVAFPIVKTRTILRNAIFSQNFRGDPLVSVLKAGNTTKEQALNMQKLLSHNLKATMFRDRAFRKIKLSASKYGTAVAYTVFNEDSKKGFKTQQTAYGIDRVFGTLDKNQLAINIPIHILNFITDPDITDHYQSPHQGHEERINLSTLINRVGQNPDNYIGENVKKVILRAKKESLEDKDYYSDVESTKNNKFKLDLYRTYAQINIKGNEDDVGHYYLEIVGGKIIRIQRNPNDRDLVPYSVFTYYPRDEAWWGNSDSEFVLPHENFTNLTMGIKADNMLRAMQQHIFHAKGTIDPSDWNNRVVNGGMVGVDLKDGMDLNKMLHFNQFTDTSVLAVDSMMREIKENQQQLSARPDFFSRTSRTGPLQNTTATATNVLEEQGDVIESEILEGFEAGLKTMSRNDLILLQQRLPNDEGFQISPDANSQLTLEKQDILGDFAFSIKTSLTRNKTNELIRLQNFFTFLMNLRGTQDPAAMRINLPPIVERLLKSADVGDLEEVYPEQQEQSQMSGGVQAAPLTGAVSTM